MTRLYDDPRWIALHSGKLPCPACGEVHDGLFDLVSDKPDVWTGPAVTTPKPDAGSSPEELLVDDFCIMRDTFFVRCDLELPVIGAPGKVFTFGVWARVSRTDFQRYVAWLDNGRRGSLPPFTGWLANTLKGYPETRNVSCRVVPQPLLPTVTMLEPHLITREQRSGVMFSRILDLYALNGHDLRIELLEPEAVPKDKAKSKPRIDGFRFDGQNAKGTLIDAPLRLTEQKS